MKIGHPYLLLLAPALAAAAVIVMTVGAGGHGKTPDFAPPATLTVYQTPQSAPSIHFQNASGQIVDLRDFRGRVVLINLWAIWCAPCRKELPGLDRLERQLGGADFVVVAIAEGHAGLPAVRKLYRAENIHRLQRFADTGGHDLDALGAVGLPTSFLIGRHGKELAYALGRRQWTSKTMVTQIRKLTGVRAQDTP